MADDLLNDLLAIAPADGGGQQMRIPMLFGDRPDILDAIRSARRDRKASWQSIADLLSRHGHRISATAVRNWLVSEGIE